MKAKKYEKLKNAKKLHFQQRGKYMLRRSVTSFCAAALTFCIAACCGAA